MSFPNVETTITVVKYFEASEGHIWYNFYSNGEIFIHNDLTGECSTVSAEDSKKLYEALKELHG